MKLFVYLIFLLAVSFSVQAVYMETVFNGTVFPANTTQLTTGRNFAVYGSDDPNNVMIKFDFGLSYFLENNTCDEKQNMRVCLENALVDHYDWNTPDPIRHTTYTVRYRYELSIRAASALLELVRSMDGSLAPDEEGEVISVLKNVGGLTAEDIVLNETIPEGIQVTGITGCILSGNNVVWKGFLNTNQEASCEYKIKGKTPGEYTFKADATYSDGISKNIDLSEDMLVIEPHRLGVSLFLNNYTPSVGSNITFSSRFIPTEILSAKISFDFPPSVKVLDSPIEGNLFEGKINKQTDLNFTLKSISSGTSSIQVKAEYSVSGISSEISSSISLNSSMGSGFITTKEVLDLTATEDFTFTFINPTKYIFYNLTPRIVTTLPLEFSDNSFEKLPPLTNHEFSVKLKSKPENNSKHTVRIDIDYFTEYGEKRTEHLETEVTVRSGKPAPKKEPIIDTHPQEQATEPQEEKTALLLILIPGILVAFIMIFIYATYHFKKL